MSADGPIRAKRLPSAGLRFLLCAFLCWGLSTRACVAETMVGALAKAYLSNAELDEQRANVRVRDEDVPKARAGRRPRAAISANGGPQRTWLVQPNGINVFGDRLRRDDKYSGVPKNGTASVTWTLFDGGKTENSVRQAESGVFAARANLRQSEQETLLNAATAYMNVLRDSAVVTLRRNNVTVLVEQLRVTRNRAEFGEVTITDLAQAQAALAQARADHAAAQGALENSIAMYVQVIGETPTRLEAAPKLDHLLPKSRDDAIDAALVEHPVIASALHQVDAAEAAVHVAESALMPTAGVGAQAVQQYDSFLAYPGTRQSSLQVFGQLNVPLYQGGAEYSGIRQAKQQLGQARLHASVLRNKVRAAIVQAFSQFKTADAALKFNQTAVKSAEVALAGVRNEAAFGQRTTLDVLNAQQALLNTRVNLVTSQRDRVIGAYAILSATGRLSVASLNLDVPAYDPATHFDQVKDSWFGVSTPEGQ